MWYISANKVPPQFSNPPGYASNKVAVAMMRGAATDFDRKSTLEQCIVSAGSPDTVMRKTTKHDEAVGGYGHVLVMGQAGFLEHEETVRGIKMLGTEVHPRLKELALSVGSAR